MADRVVDDADRGRARALAVSLLAGGASVEELVAATAPLHVRHDLFPGEVLIGLAGDALAESGASRANPIEGSGIRDRLLPEHRFSGSTAHARSRYALHAAAMAHARVEPDLLDDAGWYQADDFWLYATYALVIYVRAAAEHSQRAVPDICRAIAARHNIAIPA